MNYWDVIPRRIRKTKRLDNDEKAIYYEIWDTRTPALFSNISNDALSKALGLSEKTVSTKIKTMKEKGYLNIYLNPHKHKRYIYLNDPGEPSIESKPTEKQLTELSQEYEDALKKTIVLGQVPFETLIERIKDVGYLTCVHDNKIQFALTLDQIIFLSEFHCHYPDKPIDCQIANYPAVDYLKLASAISESKFLKESKNLTLKWFLENATKVTEGVPYKNFKKQTKQHNFTGRNYSREEMNSFFQNIDEIEI